MEARRLHVETPLIDSIPLARRVGRPIWLKMEALQPTGSFKIRGIGLACRRHLESGCRRFVSSSGGNAGLAVAYAGRQLGVPVTVVVPLSTPERARALIKDQGAEVFAFGKSWQEAHSHAQTMLDDGVAYLHPFDDPVVWEGHASLIRETLSLGLEIDTVVLSVGGGGLLCGVAHGLNAACRPDTTIVTAETAGADSFHQSVQSGRLVELERITSVATSLGARKVAAKALEISSQFKVTPRVVSDREAVDACLQFADDHRVVVEPACGAALALAYGSEAVLQKAGNVLLIVCGGAGVSYLELVELRKAVDQAAEADGRTGSRH
jgi:L-serine/L-threonine ammonia-lyase